MLSRRKAKEAGEAMKAICEETLLAMAPDRCLTIEMELESYWHGFWPWQRRHRVILILNFTEKDDFLEMGPMVERCVQRFVDRPENSKLMAWIQSRLIHEQNGEGSDASHTTG